jgi:hypothetical protein
MTDLRYPIGKFRFEPSVAHETRRTLIDQIADAPKGLRSAVAGLNDAQLNTPYRPEGWTVRQVVHHVPDSHLNAYVRFKLALTEDTPTIKPYDEAAWAKVADTARTPVDVSLTLLDALHHRWVVLLESLESQDFARRLVHPDHGPITIDWMLQLYAWHGRHHTAHVSELRKREKW